MPVPPAASRSARRTNGNARSFILELPVQRQVEEVGVFAHAIVGMEAALRAVTQAQAVVETPFLLVADRAHFPGAKVLLPVISQRDKYPVHETAVVAAPQALLADQRHLQTEILFRVEIIDVRS